MNDREKLEASFMKLYTELAKMDLGARKPLITETIVMCRQTVFEVFDGPELPVREYSVPAAQLAAANRECERLRKAQPPYGFPRRIPTKYDCTAKGEVWVVCGPLYKDGTGWRWDMTPGAELVDGDIWVPIHLLHTDPIPEVVSTSLAVRGTEP